MSLTTYEVKDGVAWLVMGSDDRMTTMDVPIMRDLRAGIDRAWRDDDVKVVVLTGRGRAFMAGADLDFVRSASRDDFREFARENQALAAEMIACDKPIIAGINGHAVGGGLELALACDLRICAAEAKLGFPEVTIGLLHSTGSSYLLSRTVGYGRAKELTLTGRMFGASDALEYGLVTTVLPASDVPAESGRIANSMAGNARLAMGWAKKLFDAGTSGDVASALALEEIGNLACFDSDDRRKNLETYLDRLRPARNEAAR